MPQTTDIRTDLLENIAAKARFYLEKQGEFLEREKGEGREFQHWISPRVAFAYRDLVQALTDLDELDELDEEGDPDAV